MLVGVSTPALRDSNLPVERFADSFALATEAQGLITRVQLYPELQHTTGARILCVLSQPTVMLRGDPCRAFIGEPKVQGPLRPLFQWFIAMLARPLFEGEAPEFVVVIDAALWSSSTKTQRERLIFHELKHLVCREDEDGQPRLHEDGRYQLRTTRHDHEVFEDEIKRFPDDVDGLEALTNAIVVGNQRAREKRKRRA